MTRGAALDVRPDDLLGMTLGQVLEAHARQHPDLHCLTVDGKDYTYGELWTLSGSVATALARRGLRRGDRVTTWLPNGIEWLVSAFALARLGVVNVLTNSRFRAAEVAALVSRSGSCGLITAQEPGPELTSEVAGEALKWTVAVEHARGSGPIDWTELTGTRASEPEVSDAGAGVSPDDTLYVMFTSGTTGLSKGSMTRHGAAMKNAFNSGERMGFTDDDRLLCFLPMSHTFGAVNAFLNSLTHGSRLDLEPAFEPGQVLDLVSRLGITALYGVPTHYALLLNTYRDAGRTHDLSSLTKGCIAGGVITDELTEALEHDLAIPDLTHAYGMTESSALISQSSWDDPVDVRIGTTGRAMPDVALRLVHGETGEDVGAGEPGNIMIGGFGVHAGYLGMDRDPSMRDDGWWDTGDIGSLDAGGNLTILGRSKDMYKTRGFNVYPAEVEAYLCTHAGVSEAAVVGIPHEIKSETGVAFLIPAPGATIDEAEIQEFVRAGMAGYKAPEHVLVVDDFPRSSATLKIQKHELRAQVQELLSTRQAAR
jgi:acyl-CoA synthetase (AMP-forming)/AMP-acid ligase II